MSAKRKKPFSWLRDEDYIGKIIKIEPNCSICGQKIKLRNGVEVFVRYQSSFGDDLTWQRTIKANLSPASRRVVIQFKHPKCIKAERLARRIAGEGTAYYTEGRRPHLELQPVQLSEVAARLRRRYENEKKIKKRRK